MQSCLFLFPCRFRYYYYYNCSPISGDECAVVVATVLQGEIGYNSTCSLRTTASATEAAVAVAAKKSMLGYCAIVAAPHSTALLLLLLLQLTLQKHTLHHQHHYHAKPPRSSREFTAHFITPAAISCWKTPLT